MKIKYHLLYVKVYNSVKLSEPQISLKKNMQHHAECKEPTGIKLLKAL